MYLIFFKNNYKIQALWLFYLISVIFFVEDLFFLHFALIYLLKFHIDPNWQHHNYQEEKSNDSCQCKIRKFIWLAFHPRRQTRFNPFADAPRRAAAPSSSRWCSLLNQRGIQMAADAPGIQIGAINPRKAALELQPNVSRPAITRPSPASCYRVLAASEQILSSMPEKRSTTRDLASFGKKGYANFNLILSPIIRYYKFYCLSRSYSSYMISRCDYFSNRDRSRVSFSIKAGKRNIEYSNGRGHKFASASNWKGNRRRSQMFLFWGQRGREGEASHRREKYEMYMGGSIERREDGGQRVCRTVLRDMLNCSRMSAFPE